MITIVKGKEKIVCTVQTFHEQYEQLGYQIASNDKGATKKVAPIIKEDKNQDKKELKDIKEEQKSEEKKINAKYGLNTKKGKK